MRVVKFLWIIFSLATISAMQGITAVDYTVTNTAANTSGGTRFVSDIGISYSLETMNVSTDFIWNTFQQTSPADRKPVQNVTLFIDDMDGVAYTMDNQIHFSTRYIQGYSGDLKMEFTGIIFHEMTHVWQWSGNGQTPGGLIEGVADFVRLTAGFVPSHWVKPGQGSQWDQGYDVTARFLDYCNSLKNDGFVAKLNEKMKTAYNEYYFVELLGERDDQLWKDYKAKYNSTDTV